MGNGCWSSLLSGRLAPLLEARLPSMVNLMILTPHDFNDHNNSNLLQLILLDLDLDLDLDSTCDAFLPSLHSPLWLCFFSSLFIPLSPSPCYSELACLPSPPSLSPVTMLLRYAN
ncbi:hypothetical protein TIFTF001_022659 [Ficus carica]|uniref:Uncharacterized protein n=1 Tax=Ficus carica TaxID=3494 RepID=A0AA88DBW6_FICCA|nr:hypothetical protein TIFTF001_022659 [Ficus carica]